MKVKNDESGVKREKGRRETEILSFSPVRRFAGSPVCFSFLLLFVACGLFSSAVLAEEKTITLADASLRAISSYEATRLSEEDLYQAEKGIDKALSQILPTLTADANYTKYSESETSGGFNVQPDESSSFNLRLTQPLYSGGKEWSLWRQAKKKREASRYGLEETKESIVLDVARAYYAVLKAEKIMEIKEASLKRAAEQRRVASARFQVGEATRAIVLRAEAEVASAEAELTAARKDLIVGKDKLSRLIGESDEFKVTDPRVQPLSGITLSRLITLSLEKRRDYIQIMIDEEIAEEGINYAWGNFLPSLKLEGVYSRRDQDPKSTLFNEESMYAGVTFTYPLFEGGLRKAELDEARSKMRQMELRRINLRKNIELEVREAFHNTEALQSMIESNKKQVSFAEENYTMVFKQFTYGLATNIDVIDANTTLVSSQNSLINATYDYQMAILEVKKRVGVLLDDMVSEK